MCLLPWMRCSSTRWWEEHGIFILMYGSIAIVLVVLCCCCGAQRQNVADEASAVAKRLEALQRQLEDATVERTPAETAELNSKIDEIAGELARLRGGGQRAVDA